MMDRTQKLVIEIDPLRATMVLKQEILGVISRKEICPEDLFQAIIHATDRKTFVSSGLLPKGVLLRRDLWERCKTVLPALPAALRGYHIP